LAIISIYAIDFSTGLKILTGAPFLVAFPFPSLPFRSVVPGCQVVTVDQSERIIRIFLFQLLQCAFGEQEFLGARVQSVPFQPVTATSQIGPWLARLMADDDLSLVTERFSPEFENEWLIRGNGPPHLIFFAMNPNVAVGITDDAHEIVPPRHHRKSRLTSPSRLSFHPEIKVASTVTCIPELLSFNWIHRGNRAAREALRPSVVFATKIGDKNLQGVTNLPAAVLSESLK
jgi:hypothetical protein